MSIRDKLSALAGRLRSILFPAFSVPQSRGPVGELDPDDWPDDLGEREQDEE
jgi:hypothetical protein